MLEKTGFGIGSKVWIICSKIDNDRPEWNDDGDMDEYMGKQATIIRKAPGPQSENWYNLDIDDGRWTWPERWLFKTQEKMFAVCL